MGRHFRYVSVQANTHSTRQAVRLRQNLQKTGLTTQAQNVLTMAEIINLRQARKRQLRTQAEQAAATNRARFGRSKAEKQAQQAEDDLARRTLDGKQLLPPGPDERHEEHKP